MKHAGQPGGSRHLLVVGFPCTNTEGKMCRMSVSTLVVGNLPLKLTETAKGAGETEI